MSGELAVHPEAVRARKRRIAHWCKAKVAVAERPQSKKKVSPKDEANVASILVSLVKCARHRDAAASVPASPTKSEDDHFTDASIQAKTPPTPMRQPVWNSHYAHTPTNVGTISPTQKTQLYTNPYTHQHIQSCMQSYTHSYTHAYPQSYSHPYTQSHSQTYAQPYMHQLAHPSLQPQTRPYTTHV